MGIPEFFGTLSVGNITSSAFLIDFKNKTNDKHMFIDFNSIIHTSSQGLVSEINIFMKAVLANIYSKKSTSTDILIESFNKFKMPKLTKEQESNTIETIKAFHDFFDEENLDKMVIARVIKTIIHLLEVYCSVDLKTLLLAIDGCPSVGKMIEQKQRRYIGTIIELYKRKILKSYKEYLKSKANDLYLAEKYQIQWFRGKITPGTGFMHKMSLYLNSEKIQNRLRQECPKMNILVSDMYEVGEGEKKIVNYINKFLYNTKDSIMLYSPDADMILLCMLLPIKKVNLLRHNQQTKVHDLININQLKDNIALYINNNPNYKSYEFDTDRINYDLVCASTIFGNDFVPKVESLSVKRGFQNIMDAYLKTLIKLENEYLVNILSPKKFGLNFEFFKLLLTNLVPDEQDFIKNNAMYNTYIDAAKIKNIFHYMNVTSNSIKTIVGDFISKYEDFKNLLKNNRNEIVSYTDDKEFMSSLKKALRITNDVGEQINLTGLETNQLLDLLRNNYSKYHNYPRLNISLNTYYPSYKSPRHMKKVKDLNDYELEVFKFNNLVDEYYIKFNTQPLDLSPNKINDYYKTYFDINLLKDDDLSKPGFFIMEEYLEGILWVFNYYFNDTTYINTYRYKHERAPLITHLLMYINKIKAKTVDKLLDNLEVYKVTKISNYWNPIEQLIYVSPLTDDTLNLLPDNYHEYLEKNKDKLPSIFVDVKKITDNIYNKKICENVDCHSISYFNKCLFDELHKPTKEDDNIYLKFIRKVEPSTMSIRRSINAFPDY